MDYSIATNNQLLTIIISDSGCPSFLLEGVAEELIKRRLWDGIIIYAAKKAFHNVEFVMRHRLLIDWQELIHIGHIEIMKQAKNFKPGMRTLKTFSIMCLITKFIKMNRDATAEIRYANIGAKDVDGLEEKIQEKIFQSPVNVERTVINKIMIENGWDCLREVEKKAILLEQEGYEQYEIATLLGYKSKTHGNTLLKRAYAKLRKQMGA